MHPQVSPRCYWSLCGLDFLLWSLCLGLAACLSVARFPHQVPMAFPRHQNMAPGGKPTHVKKLHPSSPPSRPGNRSQMKLRERLLPQRNIQQPAINHSAPVRPKPDEPEAARTPAPTTNRQSLCFLLFAENMAFRSFSHCRPSSDCINLSRAARTEDPARFLAVVLTSSTKTGNAARVPARPRPFAQSTAASAAGNRPMGQAASRHTGSQMGCSRRPRRSTKSGPGGGLVSSSVREERAVAGAVWPVRDVRRHSCDTRKSDNSCTT